MGHGHERSERRNLHLHRVSFEKLRSHPELRDECLALVEQWLERPEFAPAEPWLRQWREMLSDWSLERIAELVLDPEAGQTLRQCSPLAPVLTPRERWAALEAANAEVDRER
jgi:hypothetical protein